jgi:hypothetical protein
MAKTTQSDAVAFASTTHWSGVLTAFFREAFPRCLPAYFIFVMFRSLDEETR